MELAARELAFVHHQVKRMLVVIALFTNGVKAGDELGFGEQRLFENIGCWRGHTLEVELHAIVGDFEAGIQHDAVLGAFFVKDGVGVVDVNQDFAAFGVRRNLLQEAAGAGERLVVAGGGGSWLSSRLHRG